jgi:hypothetical protein
MLDPLEAGAQLLEELGELGQGLVREAHGFLGGGGFGNGLFCGGFHSGRGRLLSRGFHSSGSGLLGGNFLCSRGGLLVRGFLSGGSLNYGLLSHGGLLSRGFLCGGFGGCGFYDDRFGHDGVLVLKYI